MNGTQPATALPRPAARPERTRGLAPALRWAAGIVLMAAAAGSAAVLGVRTIGPTAAGDAPGLVSAPLPEAAPAPDASAAVAVAPLNGAVEVTIANAAADTRVLVRFTPDTDAMVEVAGASARFQARPGAVTVDLRGESGTVTVNFPRTLRQGAIRAGGDIVARTSGDQIEPPEAAENGITIAPPS